MNLQVDGDLAYAFHATKGGNVTISRGGKIVAALRGGAAQRFLAKADGAPFAAQQQLMARVTGNYKRGNERLASTRSRSHGTSDA